MKYTILAVAALASALPLAAQTSTSSGSVSTPAISQAQANAALADWQQEHGTSWRLRYDDELGQARFLYGGKAAPRVEPSEDADFFGLTRDALLSTDAFHAVDVSTLVDHAVRFIPTGLAGSTDKMSVELHQSVDGLAVTRGWVNALFALDGSLLALDIQAHPNLAAFDTEPGIDGAAASTLASRAFFAATGLPVTDSGEPELLIHRIELDGAIVPVLAWVVEKQHRAEETIPVGYLYYIDAETGAAIDRESTVHEFDVSGTLMSNVSPGTLPDKAGNPPVPQPIQHLRVTNDQNGNVAYTDANGFFNIVGATPGVQATFEYDGLYTTTNNGAGADYTLTQTLPNASGNSVLMNPAPTEFITSQANSANWVSLLREWVVAANPGDTAMDQVWGSNVNEFITCNAFYNGDINFGRALSGCVNTAYSSVVGHELGHGLNINYNTGNGPDGMGEGMADVFAMYSTDDPIVARDFCGAGCFVRTGENLVQFCGDCCGGCHGGTHADGQVLMGAMWKVRRNLKNTLGNSAGSAVADGLVSGWNNVYNQTQIKSIILEQWITLDDDDGNIANGSPNYADINSAFVEQGFPSLDICPAPIVYCTAKSGLICGTPAIDSSGLPSASTTSGFEIFAGPARGQRSGILVYGNSGPASFPFQGGLLCVNPPLLRSVLQSSGGTVNSCDGEFRIDMNAFASGNLGGNPAAFLLQVGQTVNTQWWGRDSVATGSFLSDGLEYDVCP